MAEQSDQLPPRGGDAGGLPRVALCTMVRNEAAYLLEWLAFHELNGVSLFRVYDDNSDDGTAAVLDQLSAWFRIERVLWTQAKGPGRQAAAFLHGANALRGRADWVGFLDSDEFLFDPEFRPLPQVLAGFPADAGAIAVNQRVFGSSWHDIASYEPVTQRFTFRAVDDYPEHTWIKTVARPEAVASFHTQHAVRLQSGRYVLGDGGPFETAGGHPGHGTRIAAGGLRMHHYMVKSLEEFRRKQNRGAVSDGPAGGYRRFTDDYFTQRVDATNAVEDRTLLALSSRLNERMFEALNISSGAIGAELG
jgi:glycosyltransferase involved in cell wall biosynthesis